MLLAGTAPPEIARTLGVPRPGLESRLWSLLRKIEALPGVAGEVHGAGARIGFSAAGSKA
jgi:hypothetical protein